MPLTDDKSLTRYDIKRLANIQLQGIANMCVLLNEQDGKLFLNYCYNGLRSLTEGFNAKEEDVEVTDKE